MSAPSSFRPLIPSTGGSGSSNGNIHQDQDPNKHGPQAFQNTSRPQPVSNSVLVQRFRPIKKRFVSNVNAAHVPMDSMDRPRKPASDTEMNTTVSSDSRSHSLSCLPLAIAKGSDLSHSALYDITNHKGAQDQDDSKIASNGISNLKSKAKETLPANSSSTALLPAQGNATASASNNSPLLKRSADDLDSISSNSSSSHADHSLNISNASPDSDQDTKRQRSTSSSSNSGSSTTSINTSIHTDGSTSRSFDLNDQGKQGLLHLLCAATDIVTMRMDKAMPQNASASNSQHLSHHPKCVSAMVQGPKNPRFAIDNGAGNIAVAVAFPVSIPASAQTAEKGERKSCNCPRSRCIKLYCECFQGGRYCSSECCCKACLNSESESGSDGKRTLSIQNILSRNPFAFYKDKALLEKKNNRASGINCRCVKSQCLKLYCDCFQSGLVCGTDCMCVKCLNTVEESGDYGEVTKARALRICRNPDAFKKKTKKTGEGCSCKNSKCLKKYCDCFNNGLLCTPKCSCRDCQNYAPVLDGPLKQMADV